MNNKGNVQTLVPVIIIVIMVGMLMAVGLSILSSVQEAALSETTVAVANESLGIPTPEGITLTTGANAHNGVCNAVTGIFNTTGVIMVGLANITQTGCTITNATIWAEAVSNGTVAVKYSYTYNYDAPTIASNASVSAQTAATSIASTWLPIIIICVAAGIVIMILAGSFARKKK